MDSFIPIGISSLPLNDSLCQMLGDLRQIRPIPTPWRLRVWQRNQLYMKSIMAVTRHSDSRRGDGEAIIYLGCRASWRK